MPGFTSCTESAIRVNESIKERIRESIDIVDLISEYVALQPQGSRFRGLCPFHQEKTPSFSVNREGQFYYCFGCKASGDIYRFIQEFEHLTFPEALESLAQRAGIPLEYDMSDSRKKDSDRRKKALELNHRLANFFHLLLKRPTSSQARDYLQGRGIDHQRIEQFMIGFAPGRDALVHYAGEHGIAPDFMEAFGFCGRRENGTYYDRFRNRITFPIADARNRIVGFGARALGGDEPKYLNTPENTIFHKGRCLFGLPQAVKAFHATGFAVVVEGYTDVIMCHQHGVTNTVAALGTAFTNDHVQLLKRYAQRAVLVFDPDESGRTAAQRSLGLFLQADMEASVCFLPGGLDPCDFLLAHGAASFKQAIAQSLGMVEAMIAFHRERGLMNTPQARGRVIDQILQRIAAAPKPATREMLLRSLSERTGVRFETLSRQMMPQGDRRTHSVRQGGPAASSPGRRGASKLLAADLYYKDFLALCLLHGKVFAQYRILIPDDLVQEDTGPNLQLLHSMFRFADRADDFDLGKFLSALDGTLQQHAIRLKEEEYAGVDLEKLYRDCQRALERHLVKEDLRKARMALDPETEWRLQMRDHELRRSSRN